MCTYTLYFSLFSVPSQPHAWVVHYSEIIDEDSNTDQSDESDELLSDGEDTSEKELVEAEEPQWIKMCVIITVYLRKLFLIELMQYNVTMAQCWCKGL